MSIKNNKALVCSEYFYPNIGGAQEISRRIADILSEKYDVHILTTFDPSRDKHKIFKIHQFKISGNYVTEIKGEVNNVISFLKKNYFDLVVFYAAQQWTFDIFIKNNFLFKKEVRYFFIPCGFSKLHFPHYYFYFKKIINISHFFEKIIFHTTSGKDFNFLSKKVNSDKFSIIKNGYIKEKTIKKIYLKKNNELVIPYIANFNYLKGQLRLIRLLNKINLKLPIKLIFFSSSNYKDKFFYYRFFLFYKKFFLKNKMIKIQIQFDAPRKQILDTLSNSYIYLFCSRLEYSPLVIFEAIQFGLPIISFNVGDLEEVVEKNNFGFVVKNNNEFIKSLAIILNNKEIFNKFRTNILKKRMLFSWDNFSVKYRSIFYKK